MNDLQNYLEKELGINSPVVRMALTTEVTKHSDIAEEFGRWLETRKYDDEGIEVGGYRAKDIHEMAPQLTGIGVFNFLVTLRDEPDEAKKIIQDGFVVL